jgi:hypothetical protein
MSFLTQGRTLVIGVAIILIVNAIALGGAAYNRSGSPDSTLHLSQRELSLPWRSDDENSGMALSLKWRVPAQVDANAVATSLGSYFAYGHDPAWLDAAKLKSLGFDVTLAKPEVEVRQDYRPLPRREVLLVLELDGPAYRQSLERMQRLVATSAKAPSPDAKTALRREAQEDSRLFIVDAGLDAQDLRAKYPDRSHYAIVRGTVRPQWTDVGAQRHLSGMIDQLSADTMHVPIDFRPFFVTKAGRAYSNTGAENSLPFTADVAFGKRFEPWIVGVSGK